MCQLESRTRLLDGIKNLGAWWHCLESTWVIKTDMTALEIRHLLRPDIATNEDRCPLSKIRGKSSSKLLRKGRCEKLVCGPSDPRGAEERKRTRDSSSVQTEFALTKSNVSAMLCVVASSDHAKYRLVVEESFHVLCRMDGGTYQRVRYYT